MKPLLVLELNYGTWNPINYNNSGQFIKPFIKLYTNFTSEYLRRLTKETKSIWLALSDVEYL